jgi:hypothetical protein
MNSISHSLVGLFALLMAGAASSALAQNLLYHESFEDTTKTTIASFGWAEFRGGANPSGSSTPSLNSSGATLLGGDRHLFINANTTNQTVSWFAGMRYTYAQSLPTLDLSLLSLDAKVTGGGTVGPIGAAVLRIESSPNNWIGFSIPAASLSQGSVTTGGLLSQPTASLGTFDASASSFNLVVAFADTISTWGNDSSNVLAIGEISFAQIPEPSTYTLGMGLLALTLLGVGRYRASLVLKASRR